MKELLQKKSIHQFITYFCVGGIATVVDWVLFYILANVLNIHYSVSTIISFIFSTVVNWFVGRIWTFKDNEKYKDNKGRELVLIFAVSAVGMGANVLLMWIFVTLLGMDSPFLKMVSKILSTTIVFFWNFFSRKLIIYREPGRTEANVPDGQEEQ